MRRVCDRFRGTSAVRADNGLPCTAAAITVTPHGRRLDASKPELASKRREARECAAFLEQGRRAIEQGRHNDAVRALSSALQYASASASVFAERARAYYEQGDYEQALADTSRALRLQRDNLEALEVCVFVCGCGCGCWIRAAARR